MHQQQSSFPQDRAGGAGARRRAWKTLAACVAAASLCGGALAASASAALPVVNTGSAQAVSFGSATLTGTIDPNGANTSYYFQYGPTKAYGSQTAIADVGSGTKTVTVKLAVSGLVPLTEYHYRLVAINSSVPVDGADRHLTTTKVPLSLAILSSPDPVIFGGTVTVQGTLSGTDNANRPVMLEENPFPFPPAGPFVAVPAVNVQNTLSNGAFTFTVPALGASTQFRVVTTTSPPVISPVAAETVSVKVSSHIAKTKKHGFVRVFGTVTPAENGAQIGILRIQNGHGVLAAGTILKPLNAASSTFSKVVHVRPGLYRVLARIVNAPVASNYGIPLKIR
jgi:hypothetical protein